MTWVMAWALPLSLMYTVCVCVCVCVCVSESFALLVSRASKPMLPGVCENRVRVLPSK